MCDEADIHCGKNAEQFINVRIGDADRHLTVLILSPSNVKRVCAEFAVIGFVHELDFVLFDAFVTEDRFHVNDVNDLTVF